MSSSSSDICVHFELSIYRNQCFIHKSGATRWNKDIHNTTLQRTAQHNKTKHGAKVMIHRARRASKWEQKWNREKENQIDREIENTTKNGHNPDATANESSNHKPINRTQTTLRIDQNHIEFLHHKATAHTNTHSHRYTLSLTQSFTALRVQVMDKLW